MASIKKLLERWGQSIDVMDNPKKGLQNHRYRNVILTNALIRVSE